MYVHQHPKPLAFIDWLAHAQGIYSVNEYIYIYKRSCVRVCLYIMYLYMCKENNDWYT